MSLALELLAVLVIFIIPCMPFTREV